MINFSILEPAIIGLTVGTGMVFWRRMREMEERCEFISFLRQDLRDAFEAAERVLSNSATPATLRELLLHLIEAHADKEAGKQAADIFVDVMARTTKPNRELADTPIAKDMSMLARDNQRLAKDAHRSLASLAFGLAFLHHADHIKVEKVQEEAVRDPGALWARITNMFGNGGNHPHMPGGMLHV